jgi:pimeloyl-ACP methyl ester carboxylesterase
LLNPPSQPFLRSLYDRMGQPFRLGLWFGRTALYPVVEFAFLRARWKYGLNLGEASPEDSVAASVVTVLLIHGQIDGNIPLRHSCLIHARNRNTVLWKVPNADHCGAMSAASQEFEQRVLAWFSVYSPNQK